MSVICVIKGFPEGQKKEEKERVEALPGAPTEKLEDLKQDKYESYFLLEKRAIFTMNLKILLLLISYLHTGLSPLLITILATIIQSIHFSMTFSS